MAVVFALLAVSLGLGALEPDFGKMFGGDEGCFYAREMGSGRTIVFNEARAKTRFPPCSTYKIPHLVFALDAGVVKPTEVFKWDGKPRGRESWDRDQMIPSAVRESVRWVFEEIEHRLGKALSKAYVDKLAYGNRNVDGYPQAYWLMSSLKISAVEQVELLSRLVEEKWPFDRPAQQMAKSCLATEKGVGSHYYGKTGSGIEGHPDGKVPAQGEQPMQLGWWVGWLQRRGQTWVFAANYRGKDATGSRLKLRVRSAFVEMGLLPEKPIVIRPTAGRAG